MNLIVLVQAAISKLRQQGKLIPGYNDKTFWDDIILPPDILGARRTAPDRYDLTPNIDVYAFNGTTVIEEVSGSFEIPHTYKEGSDLRPHIHWGPTSTAVNNVKWQMAYSLADVGEVFSSETVINAIAETGGVTDEHQVNEFGIIPGTGIRIGTIVNFRLFRDPTDSQDTYTDDAFLVGLGVHYQIDSAGSIGIFSKGGD